jgi:hypothetical protein
VIYDELVSESLVRPLPDEPAPPPAHDATACPVCQAWLAHVREAEGT